jgi:hypothetical protein
MLQSPEGTDAGAKQVTFLARAHRCSKRDLERLVRQKKVAEVEVTAVDWPGSSTADAIRGWVYCSLACVIQAALAALFS